MTTTTGHTLTLSSSRKYLEIGGELETMQHIPESEINDFCAERGVVCTWVAADETSYCVEDVRAADLVAAVSAMVGDDGTGDLGIIVREALADDATVTAAEIADIVREARADHAANTAAE